MLSKIYSARHAREARKAKRASLLQGANVQYATTKAYSIHHGLGQKRWAAVVPPGGFHLNAF